MTRAKWYWTIQAIVWSLYALLGFAINSYFTQSIGPFSGLPLLVAGMMLCVTHGYRYLLKKRGWSRLKLSHTVLRLLLLTITTSLVLNLISTVYIIYVTRQFGWAEFSSPIYFLYVLQTTIYLILWLAAYLTIHYFEDSRRQEIEKWKLQSAVKDAELAALKAQVNPHFLFNALNNIRALILEDGSKARDLLANLADLLRYAIQFTDREQVSIAEELDIVEKYLALESAHFDDRLSYTLHAQESVRANKIPPMIIQMMVENAIKHGISLEADGGSIDIDISKGEQSVLSVKVTNTGRLAKSIENEGIGIKNAIDRIYLTTDRQPKFEFNQRGNSVESLLIIPE